MLDPEAASTLTVADVHAIRREAPAVGEGRYLIRLVRADPVFKPGLDRRHPGREFQLPADDELADRSRAGNHAGG